MRQCVLRIKNQVRTMVHDSKRMALGKKGEQAVGQWLQKNGFTILQYNFFVRVGEIDIIATKEEILAFVEVKTRKNRYFHLSQVITPAKQQKIIKAAKRYLMDYKGVEKVYRFDVALVIESEKSHIDYIPHAFGEGFY